MSRKPLFIVLGLALFLILIGSLFVRARRSGQSSTLAPTPPEEPFIQLEPDKQPQISLEFSSDGHYVTVNVTNLHAAALEYNLIYEATVKKNRIMTGVNASEKLEGRTQYSQKQLLGSESSGKFTYHQDIENARLELTLRDTSGRSIFTSTYPFALSPGGAVDLTSSQP